MINHHKRKIFEWQGIAPQGQMTSGEISAFSSNLALTELHRKGILQPTIKQKSSIHFKQKITTFDIILFMRQLSTLMKSGVSIAQSLTIFSQQTKNTTFSNMIASIKADIIAGNNLAKSLQKFPDYFNSITCNLLLAGEKSGTLDTMLDRVAQHYEMLLNFKNKIKHALFYPAVILLVAIIVTIIMLLFVVPRFTELFQNMHAQLPIFTRLIIHFSYGLQHYGLFILAAFISAGGIFYHIKYRPALKKMTDQFLLKFPIAGTAVEKFILIHLTRNLSTLFAAGIPLTDALNNLIHSMGNIIYRNALQNIAKDLSVGKQLHFALQNCRLFPAMMVQMIQIGEESGALEKMLVKIAEFYESDLDYLIGHLSRLLEPLIMIILGVVIGGLVIAMYLPIFKLGTVI